MEVFQHKAAEERQKEVSSTSKVTNLYVQGLPADITVEKVRALFEEFGKVTSCELPKREHANKLGHTAYVAFEDSADAKKAIDAMNKKRLDDGSYLLVNQHVNKRDNEVAKTGKIE